MTADGTKKTALYDLHVRLGAKMTPFAGHEMPVQYQDGILAEHGHTRAKAGLFDVSHMGQAVLRGADVAAAFEELVPGDISGLAQGQIRYTQLTNDQGGIIDDLMVTNRGDHLFLVVNAGCKGKDFGHIKEHLGSRCDLDILDDRGLIAFQGPAAADVLSRFAFGVASLPFMTMQEIDINGISCLVSRSGYTGEDGYEISVPGENTESLAELLLNEAEVAPIGLGARDSLRLEAGLCLYGHDIDDDTTPIEAGLLWSIGKRRRQDGGFLGADTILQQISDGAPRKRIGIKPVGRAPARKGTEVTDTNGTAVGRVTSGGFGPTVQGPVAMGYVIAENAMPETSVELIVRGKSLQANLVRLPFVEHRYFRG